MLVDGNEVLPVASSDYKSLDCVVDRDKDNNLTTNSLTLLNAVVYSFVFTQQTIRSPLDAVHL
jgi:hypothetical protein